MSNNQKISVIILGNEEYLKQNLISFVIGKDISAMSKKENVKNHKIFENDMYEFTYTTKSKEEDDEIREMFSENPNPDMCLVLVKEGFREEEVWNQIENMSKTTGKPTEEFIVVLPQGQTCNCYIFKSYTREELLRKLAEYRQLEANNKKSDDLPESQTAEETDKEVTGEAAVNLVLLGMAGTGKSACGNTILMDNRFTSRVSSKPVTTECQMAEKQINGINVRVIDTPDIFDDDIESSVKKENVKKCKQLCESGPCVYLLVMHVSRFTDGERDILTKLERAFGSRVKEQTIIVFTRGDDLHRAGMSLESFLGTCDPNLKNIVDKCGRRCVLFENSSSHSGQVEKLMARVLSMLEQ
ncbi:GTPase IMAP family member 1-like isoform 2-T2 [Odontesthes bonariensis]|uniref:GTPase IMAP family member 1-like isoform X2 n=1 Tax=Odontesthes bonariensis TaxID=219752 RepID=UPI003F58F783